MPSTPKHQHNHNNNNKENINDTHINSSTTNITITMNNTNNNNSTRTYWEGPPAHFMLPTHAIHCRSSRSVERCPRACKGKPSMPAMSWIVRLLVLECGFVCFWVEFLFFFFFSFFFSVCVYLKGCV